MATQKQEVKSDKKVFAPPSGPIDEKQELDTKMVAPRESNAPTVASSEAYDPEAWGQATLTSRDVIIPRILLMQPMSPQVTDGKAQFGEWRESLNDEALGKFEKGFDVIPFYMQKVFIEYRLSPPKKAGEKAEKEWLRTIAITPENENLRYEDEMTLPETGELIQVARDRAMNFYVLLKSELELGGAIPYIISFRKSSLNAGKKMTTQMYMKNINAGKNPASMTMHIYCKKETTVINGQNVTYAVADVKPVEQTSEKMVCEAFRWLQIIKDGKAKTHDESYAKERESDQSVGSVPSGGTGNF